MKKHQNVGTKSAFTPYFFKNGIIILFAVAQKN